MRTRLYVLLTAVGLTLACYGGGPRLPPPKVPDFPTPQQMPHDSAVITDETATLTYQVMSVGGSEQLVGVLDHRIQIKILTEAGLEYAHFQLPIDAYTSISRVFARSVDRFGNVQAMAPGAPKVVATQGPGANVPEVKMMVFDVPGAKVGGVVDVLFTRVYTAAYLIPPWVFGGPLTKLRSEFSVVYPKGFRIDHRFGKGATLVDKQPLRRELDNGATRLVFVEQNIPPYFEEPHGPHLTWTSPWVATVPVEAIRGGKKVRLESWHDVQERVMRAFKSVGAGPKEGTIKERFAAVRDALNPVDHIGLGTCPPTKASSLMGGKPACTRDAAGLLLNSLEGVDAKYYPALLLGPKGPVVTEGFPSLYGIIRAVVAVDVSEEVKSDSSCKEDPISRGLLCSVPANSYAFLDPMCTGCRFGELPSEYTGGQALVFISDEEPRWVDIPPAPLELNRQMTQFKLRLDVDGSYTGDMNGELTGAQSRPVRAALRSRNNKPPVSEEAQGQAVQQAVYGAARERQSKLTNVTTKSASNPENPLTVEGKVDGKVETLAYEKFRVNPAEVFGPALPTPLRKGRRSAAILPAPAWYETVGSLELPVGYDILEEPVTTLVTPFAEYAAGFALNGRTLSYSRRLVLKTHVITADDWPAFREFLDQVEELEANGMPVFLSETVEGAEERSW